MWHKDWLETVYTAGFNPHTYMRCDDGYKYYGRYVNVSIHTPTWGVTVISNSLNHLMRVSIHTPTWGVTWCVTEKGHTNTSFNPHTYMRCDIGANTVNKDYYVSIHTPTWGVTVGDNPFCSNRKFQSTHLHEVWLGDDLIDFVSGQFQSTHLHEVWQE